MKRVPSTSLVGLSIGASLLAVASFTLSSLALAGPKASHSQHLTKTENEVVLKENSAQEANLKALVEGSVGKGTWTGFKNMLEVLDAQGQRMPTGSATAFNNLLTQEMESGGKGAFAKYFTSLPTMAREGIQAWELGKNTEMLAKMLTDPQSVEKLNELAKTKPNSAKARNIVNSVVGGYVGQKPELAPEENK